MFLQQSSPVKIGMVLFPSLTQLDFTAPYEVFSYLPNAQIYRIASTLDPVYSDCGFPLIPNTSFEKAPALDVLFVPGGLGVSTKLEDPEFLQFLKTQGNQARCVASICTGSLLLAAAGLLQGYRATTDWFSLELLELFGVEAVSERIVVDRNRITGSSITSGIAVGLVMATELFGERVAQEIQLRLEYNPAFLTNDALKSVPPDVLAKVQTEQQALLKARLQIIRRSTATVQR